MSRREYLRESFQKFGFPLNIDQEEQFLLYADLLLDWNQRMNLTAITEFEEIVWKHFIDSAALLQSKHVSRETFGGKLIDVGSGAGFPGIPLKILFPGLKCTCLDSLQKRILFLEHVVRECGLKNVYCFHGRAEDLARDPKYREQFDWSVSRAVSNLATLSEYCLPMVRRGGCFISYKGGDAKTEIAEARKAIKVFGGEIESTEEFTLRGSELARTLVWIRKKENTPKKFPRKAGMPAKSPIR